MSLKREHFISDSTIENRATQLLANYGRQFGYVEHLPIPLEHLVEYHLELNFDCTVIPGSTADVTAALDWEKRAIYINDLARPLFDLHPGLENFSVAHEIGHWALHVDTAMIDQPPLFVLKNEGKVLCTHNAQGPREIQANRFAGYLLMPRDLLLDAIGPRCLTAWPDLYDLARAIGVSISALLVRLQQLGLVHVTADRTLADEPEGQTRLRH